MELSPGEFDSAFNDFDFRMSQWAEMQSKSVSKLFYQQWHELPAFRLPCMEKEIPIRITSNSEPIYGTNDIKIKSMKETLSHRVIRSRRNESALAKEIPHIKRPDIIRSGVYCAYPRILIGATCPRGNAKHILKDLPPQVSLFLRLRVSSSFSQQRALVLRSYKLQTNNTRTRLSHRSLSSQNSFHSFTS